MRKEIFLIIPILLTLNYAYAQSCRVCNPLEISDYAWRGLCLFANFVMCTPQFFVLIIIVGIIIYIIKKLLPG